MAAPNAVPSGTIGCRNPASLTIFSAQGDALASPSALGDAASAVICWLKIQGVSHESSPRRGPDHAAGLARFCPVAPDEFAAGQARQDAGGKRRRGGARQGLPGFAEENTGR